jgi:polyhydroxybutyrate depolymerase
VTTVGTRVRRTLALLLAAGALGASAGCAALVGARPLGEARPGTTTYHTMRVQGRERAYLLHVPASVGERPAPLLVLFHGHGGNGPVMMKTSRMNQEADARGVVVAYPEGTGRFRWFGLAWNALTCCGYAQKHQVDDVAFAQALVDTLVHAGIADPARVTAAGFSAGGMLALVLACQRAGTVAGAMPDAECRPERRIGVMLVQGEADDELRFDLRTLHRPGGYRFARSMQAALRFWGRAGDCVPTVSRDSTPRFVRERMGPCASGGAAELVTVYRNPHAWPGGRHIWLLTPKAAPMDAGALVMDFAERFRR